MGDNTCVRFSLIAVNVIFLLGGLATLGLGVWVQVEKGDYVAIADSDTGLTGAILIIVAGGVTALISFVGFLGAVKNSRVLLWLFFSVVSILIIVEIIAVVLGMVYQDKIEDELHGDMKKTIQEYGTDLDGVKKAWDWAQQKFECCGVDDYKSWSRAAEFNRNGSNFFVPDSCCKDEKNGCGDFRKIKSIDKSKIYTQGCFEELKTFIKDHLLTIGLGALGFLIIEIIVIILAVILAVSISRSSKVV